MKRPKMEAKVEEVTPLQVSFELGKIYGLVRYGASVKALDAIIHLQAHISALPLEVTGGPCWGAFLDSLKSGAEARTEVSPAPTKPRYGALNAKFWRRK